MIDSYSLQARVYPMVIFFMPAVIVAVVFSLKFDLYTHLFASFGIIGALSYLLSQLGRDAGKKGEAKMWEDWGGTPTTQLLRWNDSHINEYVKKRYHEKLYNLYPVEVMPDRQLEQSKPEKADAIYSAWCKFLISKTRDTKKYDMLFKDNISYGFRRNLWGLKPYSIILILLIMVSTYLYYFFTTHFYFPILFPKEFFIAEAILFFILLFWIIRVSKSWVKVPAFSYAERLLEAVEELA